MHIYIKNSHSRRFSNSSVLRLPMLSGVSSLMKVVTSGGPHLLKHVCSETDNSEEESTGVQRREVSMGGSVYNACYVTDRVSLSLPAGCRKPNLTLMERLQSVILAGHTSNMCDHLARNYP